VRGPVASKIATQLLLGTDWGELDYLVVDCPPGTGDVQLTLTQLVSVSGAVVVTTPHSLSHVDVLKGVAMYEHLRVPTLAVVENLAYLDVDLSSQSGAAEADSEAEKKSMTMRLHPFGTPGRHLPELRLALPSLSKDGDGAGCGECQLPVSEAISSANDTGVPFVLQHHLLGHEAGSDSKVGTRNTTKEGVGSGGDGDAASGAFRRLAEVVVRRVQEEGHAALEAPFVAWSESRRGVVVRWTERRRGGDGGEDTALEVVLPPSLLRHADPLDGAADPDHEDGKDGKDSAHPLSLEARGNYAVRIRWSDGHDHPFFTYDAIIAVAQRHHRSQLLLD